MYFLLSGCQNPDVLRFIYFAKIILDIVFTLVPIGLIVLLMIDIAKVVFSGEEKTASKTIKTIINRVIFAALLFFAPTIVSAVMNLVGNAGVSVGQDYTMCFNNANIKSIEAFQVAQDKEDKEREEKIRQELENMQNSNSGNNNGSSNNGNSSGNSNNGNNNGSSNNGNSSGNSNNGNSSGNNSGNSNNGNSFNGNSSTGNESTGNLYENLANRMIQVASAELGTKEGSNDENKYGKELGINNQPWCAIFVTWVGKHTTVNGTNLFNDVIQKYGTIKNPYSAVNSIYTFSTNENLKFYYSPYYGGNYVPKKGDYIYFNWNGNWNKNIHSSMFSEGNHVGIVEYVKDGYVYTIEGNASGGAVARLNYNLNSKVIMGYGSWYR